MERRGASAGDTNSRILSKIVLEEPEILDEKKKEQEENADYYFNEAEKIIKENDSHIPHLD